MSPEEKNCILAGQKKYRGYTHDNFSPLDGKIPIWLL